MAQELPKIEVVNTGKQYYLDWRLTQIRNVENPHDYKSFNSEWDLYCFIKSRACKVGEVI